MRFVEYFNLAVEQSTLGNVTFLSAYKFERDYKYPEVPIKQFSDYREHKAWMIKKSKEMSRKAQNKRILEDERNGYNKVG